MNQVENTSNNDENIVNNKMNNLNLQQQFIIVQSCSSLDEQEEDDEDRVDHIDCYNNANSKKSNFAQTRRCSVFSKSFDPENSASMTEPTSTDLEDTENKEAIRNQYYESNSCHTKQCDQRENLKKSLLSIVLFKHLLDEDIENIINSMFERKCTKNEIIIREGDIGDYFYVISNGIFDIYVKDKSSFEPVQESEHLKTDGNRIYGKRVSEYRNEGFFGELALLYNQVIKFSFIAMQLKVYCS